MTSKRSTVLLMQMLCISLCLLLILYSDTAYSAAADALAVLYKTVIPVLLPFTVLSSIVSDILSAKISRSSIVASFLIGNICGAPIGSIMIGRSYSFGAITKKEAEVLLPAVSCTSPAFCICAVGGGMLDNKKIGALMWIVQLIINSAILAAFFIKNKRTVYQNSESGDFTVDLSSGISRAASTICTISVSVIFFAVISAVFSEVLNLNYISKCALNSVLEMSGGCAMSSRIDSNFALPLIAFSLGLGGVSVLAQISACTVGIPKKNYIKAKLLTAFTSVAIILVYSSFFASSIEKSI